MSRKRISGKFIGLDGSAVIILDAAYDSAWGEYVVRWNENGRFNDEKSYFTDDKMDALNTLSVMVHGIKGEWLGVPSKPVCVGRG